MDFHHVSVLPEETIEALSIVPDGVYVDCTLGGAGHAARIAAQLSPKGRLIGIDRDETAIAAAEERLASAACRVSLVRDNFRHLPEILAAEEITSADGVLFDLGVSSPQIDTPERGFSYMRDAPLDMRMDRRAARTAYAVVNTYSAARLTEIFYGYGEERWAKRIAAFIEEARRIRPIETTADLVAIVDRAVPKKVRAKGGHPAKRIFQAIRIEVNEELTILEGALTAAVRALKPGGRLAVITFHSLEDRIVKRTMQKLARGCVCPPHTPVCICGHTPEIRIIGKARAAGAEECKENPRAKSAKLRTAEKI
ncbi:16S rRNA (cytosine(1402)-N(4))-methyltransferase RsmH [Selenomonas sp. F0473]|uniref:16S rRNA (cytosine(1402)-N(4))-methyltransferase RsmH n=1 Tax=Selenomonas sp. F0473 TaxID=999423 RepID=UPI00029E467C|nr:16S rRNA (cytosine(1402)-N(4))-methyltransferase RsmH [Selenomonas sp. F0473]EKU71992.1 S-adenosyl-methyltransferase MraW [Selenomonas sp. F0473]